MLPKPVALVLCEGYRNRLAGDDESSLGPNLKHAPLSRLPKTMSGNKRRLSAADKKSIEEENAASAASLEQIKKDFEFCLCLTIVLPYSEPVVVQGCSHIFHRNCITTLLGEAASAECPQCRDRFIAVDIKELRSNQPIAWRMLQNLRVACPLECGAWKGDVSNLENHFETCGKTQCPLKCGAVIKPPATFEVRFAVRIVDVKRSSVSDN